VSAPHRHAHRCFGVLAEYGSGAALLAAIEQGKAAGYSTMEAYTPLPMHDVSHALGHENDLPKWVLGGGIVGGLTGFGMQYYAAVVHYPTNVGGRPLNSWPSFIPVTFELTILFAALTAVLGMLALNGLPRPHHPVFSVPGFELASRDRFFLLVPHYDPRFDADRALAAMRATQALTVHEVPHP
jgi:ActD protein